MSIEATFSEQVTRDFDASGPLDQGMAGYAVRPEQAALSGEIADCLDSGNRLLAEAETGTGKTLAYLVPALRCDIKVLISTHTKALQDQLVFRDIPAVQNALGRKRRTALLKGRSNYLCPHRLKGSIQDHRLDSWVVKPLLAVNAWAQESADGELSGLDFDVFEAGVAALVTATAEQCLGSKCPDWNHCPLMRARSKAQEADIVVSNHSLLLADAALKSGDFGEVLPDFDAYILDEAHALPELASQHFGRQLGRARLTQWFNDMQGVLDELGDEPALKGEMTAQFRQVIDAWAKPALEPLLDSWQPMADLAESCSVRSEELFKLHARAALISEDIEAINAPPQGYVGWTDGTGEYKRHMLAPVETGPVLDTHLWQRPASFTLLSATLRISGSFKYMKGRLGLDEHAIESFHGSPFDYTSQAMLYLPRHLSAPGKGDYAESVVTELEALLTASSGRAFVLFTTHQLLKTVAPQLASHLPWPVLEQGKSGSNDAILSQFREDTHSILCGTRSFWEGVDVPGEALSIVIIDKLPFAPPSDPLLKARIKSCEESGGNGFRDIQLPEAIAVLRQGMGRLIRSGSDRGVMALLDSRIYSRGYGREVVHNLPSAPVKQDIADVQRFFGDSSPQRHDGS